MFVQQSLQPKLSWWRYGSVSYALQNSTAFKLEVCRNTISIPIPFHSHWSIPIPIPIPVPIPMNSVYASHSHGIPMGSMGPLRIPVSCTPLLQVCTKLSLCQWRITHGRRQCVPQGRTWGSEASLTTSHRSGAQYCQAMSLRNIYKFTRSRKTQRTISAVSSDALRGIPPKTNKKGKLFIRSFQSL